MKIRAKTWYWGKYITVSRFPTGPDADDFEIYDETLHGWQHSDEARNQNKNLPEKEEKDEKHVKSS